MTLVERLRLSIMQASLSDQVALQREAADRIEALEEWDRKRAADIITLGALVGKLEAALREIATRKYETGRELQAIARAALEEQKEN